ncbi:MAG: UDP-3-O-[3-hydroxymyristoyl] N-acetylglucosamine deacetylase [Planctomyces sp.]|nr:UDP-3-O-[3-hydroxymyristoyl] N-acetylglucosamine deacetylase [Planctomyces sp.]
MRVPRRQRTLERAVEMSGIGFFTNADVTISFHPQAEGMGISFQRIDLKSTAPVPARIEHVVKKERRTAISNGEATIELIEHVMAALAGLQIDNCLVRLNAPEPPGCDGSSLDFVQCLLDGGIVEQNAYRDLVVVTQSQAISTGNDEVALSASPISRHGLVITYDLDYGPRSPVKPQSFSLEVTPETFITLVAFARTFVLEDEVKFLRSQGYGQRLTEKDLLIFGPEGPIGNALRARDECVRHKILDCIGDFALIGCDLHGHFRAFRTGHHHNHQIIERIQRTHDVIRAPEYVARQPHFPLKGVAHELAGSN